MKKRLLWSLVLFSGVTACLRADSVNFTTFVTQSNISAANGGNTSVIAFNYAGNKFVGSLYPNDNQLYQTNLSGTGVTTFGSPVPGASGEIVLGVSTNQAGWTAGDVYAGSGNNGNIYHYSNSGGVPTLFATLPGGAGAIRQILFDPGSTFSGNMLVSTTSGQIYQLASGGSFSLLANIGTDTEGMDIAGSAWGPFAGQLLVGSEGTGDLHLVSNTGVVTQVGASGQFAGAETVSFVPTTLDPTDPLQGFYVANYASNIQFAAASNFTSLEGDAIVTDEFGGSTMWDVHYNSGTGTFSVTPFSFTGNAISQFEDGIFVTRQREIVIGTPEPTSIILLGSILLGVMYLFRRKTSSSQI
jgi:hypothetical protein